MILLIAAVTLLFLIIALIIYSIDDDKVDGPVLPVIILLFILIMALTAAYHSEIPKAIDVYRGNTTLEITYRDGVPIDSTVIYKHK